MLNLRPARERGHANYGWLDTNHSFSFANYHDPAHMGFRDLRVINEDRVAPGSGFDAHPHRDMEIISYVLDGAIEHRDSLGVGSVIRRGEIQCMTAGTGIVHSEFNHSQEEPLHFFQIWIEPRQTGLEPGYEQKQIDPDKARGNLHLIASPQGGDGAILIHQDVKIYTARLAPGDEVRHALSPRRHAWLQLATGAVDLNGQSMGKSDGVAVSEESELTIRAEQETELLLFDLA
ncbi:MAG: pirin family protein [SAR324 cluster bacterium]|nr:pirin family protein [SAR324 cluster bacterium]